MQNSKGLLAALTTFYSGLSNIARGKGHSISSITVNVDKSDLASGKLVGLATVGKRSRKPFSVQFSGTKANLEFMGEKIAA